MLFGLFDTFASTAEPSSRKGKYMPLLVNDSPSNVIAKLEKYLKDNGYISIAVNEDYYDVFGVRDGFEVSFIFAPNEGKSLIQINVFSEERRGRVRGRLKLVYNDVKELLNLK